MRFLFGESPFGLCEWAAWRSPTGAERVHRHPSGRKGDDPLAKQTHPIDEGRVFCPRLGHVVDFERCLTCAGLCEFDVDGKRPFVQCDPELVAAARAHDRPPPP